MPGKTTRSVKELKRELRVLQERGEVEPRVDIPRRPRKRGECAEGARPCIWVSCRWNLFLDVNPKNGSVTFRWPGCEVGEIPETCALDIADRGGVTLQEVANLSNITREAVRQAETRAALKLRRILDPDFADGNVMSGPVAGNDPKGAR